MHCGWMYKQSREFFPVDRKEMLDIHDDCDNGQSETS